MWGMTCLAVLALAAGPLGLRATAQAVPSEPPPTASPRPMLPEVARSPLLWTLRGCYALLRSEGVAPDAIRACFAEARHQLEALPAEPLQEQRRALVDVLAADPTGTAPTELAERFAQAVDVLRDEAGRVRAADSEVVLISQGGISLGSWQAGVLYAVTEHLKTKRTDSSPTLPTVTGASAGAVNGLIAASASCETPVQKPEDSLFYKVWIELGVVGRYGTPGLLGDRAQTYGLFNERALRFAMTQAREHFAKGDRYVGGRCDVQLGLTVTHLDTNDVPVHQSVAGETVITGPNLREQFALALDFAPQNVAGKGSALAVRNFVPAPPAETFLSGVPTPSRFPLLGSIRSVDEELSVDQLMLAVQGSGAFPGAFPPVTLPFSRIAGDGKPGETKHARFIDGGVFDNTPVGLAIELDELRKRAAPASAAPVTLARALVPEAPTTYLLIEPSAISWTFGNKNKTDADDADPKGIIETYAGFASQFIGSSRSAALVETIRRWPFLALEQETGLQSRMIAPRRHTPIAGEQLGAFLGFLERDFRIFDFYVGMADAIDMLERDAYLGPVAATTVDSPELACMRAYYTKVRTRRREPIGETDLPSECKALGPAPPAEPDASDVREELDDDQMANGRPSDAALALSAANFRALLVATHNYRRWTESDDVNVPGAKHYEPGYSKDLEFDKFFDELMKADYTFLDLPRARGGSDVSDSEDARRAVRGLMQVGIKQLASEQPSDLVNYAGIHVLGRATADQYHTLRPDWLLGAGIVAQGLEGVVGKRLYDWIRLDFGLRFFRIDSTTVERSRTVWKGDTSAYLQLTPVIAVWSFMDLELGIGPVVSITHAFGHRYLAAERAGGRVSLGPTFIQRFYVAAEAEYFPHMLTHGRFARYEVPLVRDWRWAVAAGFRFMW
jgi:predicted acylesterase/phospholipase RssA